MHDSNLVHPSTPSTLPLLRNLEGRHLILGSASPRRKQLMSMLGIPFEVRPLDVDEVYPTSLKGPEIPRYLSELKASAARPSLTDADILITSDTVVQLDGETLEKPTSHEDAVKMIMALSGRTHRVVTAFCIIDGRTPDRTKTDHDTTEVCFEHLSRAFVEHYVKNHKPFDKAGAYGAQDLIGACGIQSIKGSFYTVMGLPMHKIFVALHSLE